MSVPQQPKASQTTVSQQIKAPQAPAPQQIRDIPRPKAAPIAAPAQEDIAKRAYEIYLEKGCQEGQCDQNWRQAEDELRRSDASLGKTAR